MTTHSLELAERVANAPAQQDRQPFGKRMHDAGGRTGRRWVIKPHTFLWLASHELRLGWRDWIAIMTAGRRPMRNVAIVLVIIGGLMHLLSYSMVGRYAGARIEPDKATLIVVTGIMLLSFSLLLSQAMELVTRVFYSRSDLELILTSPISSRKIFSVRIGRITVEVALLAMLLAAPSIDVLAVLGGARWLLAYSVVAAMAAVAAAFAVALTLALFAIIGPKHTRLIAQIVAAVIGAAFVIGLQIAAIFSYGSVSLAPLQSAWLIASTRHARGCGGAASGGRSQHRAAHRGHPDLLGPLWRSCIGYCRRVADR
jgi:ABC-2 type transport system permease protein